MVAKLNFFINWLEDMLANEKEGLLPVFHSSSSHDGIETVVFDFDGVLLKEIGIAEQGYAWVINAIKNGIPSNQYHLNFTGNDINFAKHLRPKVKGKNIIEKIQIIRQILNSPSNHPTTEDLIQGWYGFFRTTIQNRFGNQSDDFLIPGAKDLINQAVQHFSVFGLTANEYNHAQWIMKFVGLESNFQEIVGFPANSFPLTSKASLLADLCFRNDIEASKVCFIGDGNSDIYAGRKVGVATIGIANNEMPIALVSESNEKNRIIKKSAINASKLIDAKCDFLATSTFAYSEILKQLKGLDST